jgi:Zn-dependent peptidase ImmA (M78 family)
MAVGRARQAAETAAHRLRERHGIALHEPLPDVLGLAEECCEVPVVVLPQLGDDYAGGYFRKGGRAMILLNAADPVTRMRFTLAHELGHHYFRHLEHVDELWGRDRVRDKREDLLYPSGWWEAQANAFAAELLVPGPAIGRWADEWGDGSLGLDAIVDLASRFGVSALMACIRARSEGLIDEEREARLRGEIAAGHHHELAEGYPAFEDALSAARAAAPRVPPALAESKLARMARGERSAEHVAAQLGYRPDAFTRAMGELDLLP